MSDISTETRLVLGKRYNFPQLSTREVEVLETVECWIEFYEKEFVWYCEYRALWLQDEDPDTKDICDREKSHCWKYTVGKDSIASVEYCSRFDENLWLVKVHCTGIDVVHQLAFKTKPLAEKMYKYFCQYKGFEHY